jgi:3-oxoacyl-[acyl-carrier-protein] synthase II
MNIAITGCQVSDSYGQVLSNNLKLLLAEKNRLPTGESFGEFKSFNIVDYDTSDLLLGERNLPLIFRYGCDTAIRAVEQSGTVADRSRIGVFASSLYNDAETALRSAITYSEGKARSRPYDLFYQTAEPLATIISRLLQLEGMTLSISATCSSGLFALEIASALIAQGSLDQAVILCADLSSHPFNSYKMNGSRALTPQNVSRPFDVSRNGIVMGDGIAAIVVERLETSINRKANILSVINGIGSATANYHPTNPKLMTSAYYSAFNNAISTIDNLEKIKWISAHATSTPDGDLIESQIMAELLPNRYITSFKGHLGHTMAASGLLELCYTIEAMNSNIVPHVANTIEVDVDKEIQVALENIELESEYVIKNSYGFGGRACSVIISKGKKYV